MMLTEEQARTKVCRAGGAMAAVFVEVDANDKARKHPQMETPPVKAPRCIASECMMWRWQELLADEAFGEAVVKAATEIGDTTTSRHKAAKHVMQHRAEYGLPDKSFRGWCGLAGKPEVM